MAFSRVESVVVDMYIWFRTLADFHDRKSTFIRILAVKQLYRAAFSLSNEPRWARIMLSNLADNKGSQGGAFMKSLYHAGPLRSTILAPPFS